jgi:quinol monooxygenase YgiN
MIFFLNKGLILEQEILTALKEYFAHLGTKGFYKNYSINVTNEHPFARLYTDDSANTKSLFPAVVVATLDDSKPGALSGINETEAIDLTEIDVTPSAEGEPSPLEARNYMMVTPAIIEKIKTTLAENGNHLYGISKTMRRQDRISIEIWAENIQLKNELYELVRLFVCGYMKEYLETLYKQNALSIFDESVRGSRSNNGNVEFGIELWGAYITFEADYTIEQTVIDTEIVDTNNLVWEVINHVKGQAGTTTSIIFGDDGAGV